MQRLFIGVEIGGTKTQVALGNDRGELVYSVQEKVVLDDGAAGILQWAGRQIDDLIHRGQEFGGRVAGTCVGFGGFLESATGRILTSVQVKGWKDMMLKRWFEDRSGLPTIILNDTVAGGYGEYHLGSGRGVRQFFYTNIGSGIGGVFILNGEYFDGQGYGSAFFGHTYLPDWTATTPGKPRKVEDLCSGWAIERRLRTPGYVPNGSALMTSCGGDVSRITCQALGAAATAGDAFALAEIDRIAPLVLDRPGQRAHPDQCRAGQYRWRCREAGRDPARTHPPLHRRIRPRHQQGPLRHCLLHVQRRGGSGRLGAVCGPQAETLSPVSLHTLSQSS